MPINTAHDDAAAARTVCAMAFLQSGALALGIVLASYLVRGASTTTAMVTLSRGPLDRTAPHHAA